MYDYSTLHQIIELQYAKKASSSEHNKWGGWGGLDGSFFDQSFMFGKGYITPSNYINNINNIINKSNEENQGIPLYLHNN
jgi:hypothetical protein